jgi:hypothetical protein
LCTYVDQARARADAASVTRVAIDETAARRGHDYISPLVDIDQARVLFAEGLDAATVAAFAEDLTAHRGAPGAIEEVCIDMSPAFIKGVADNLPEAAITFDKFHAVKIINEALDQAPAEALHVSPRVDSFCRRVRHLIAERGFAVVTGDPGTGKSACLRILTDQLAGERDVKVGMISRPQANIADFYREMGDLFGVALRPHNRFVLHGGGSRGWGCPRRQWTPPTADIGGDRPTPGPSPQEWRGELAVDASALLS